MFRLRALLMLQLGLLITAIVGCSSSEKPFPVKGKLTKGGQPYKLERAAGAPPLPPGENAVRMQFKRIGGTEPYEGYAILDQNAMTFEVPGNMGTGIPAGEYEVIVTANTGEKEKVEKPKTSGPPGMMMPGGPGGPPGSKAPSAVEGKEIARQKVNIPEGGRTDLEIIVK